MKYSTSLCIWFVCNSHDPQVSILSQDWLDAIMPCSFNKNYSCSVGVRSPVVTRLFPHFVSYVTTLLGGLFIKLFRFLYVNTRLVIFIFLSRVATESVQWSVLLFSSRLFYTSQSSLEGGFRPSDGRSHIKIMVRMNKRFSLLKIASITHLYSAIFDSFIFTTSTKPNN